MTQLWRVSIESIFVIIITILSIFLAYFFIKKFWPTQKGISKLLAIGTSICGVTAIMASSTILKSKDQDVAVAILIVVLWGSIAVLTYPFFVELFFLTDLAKGIFLGVSIHDTSQVLAAAMVHSDLHPNQKTLEIATITKIIRNSFLLALIPILIIFNKTSKNNKNKGLSKMTIDISKAIFRKLATQGHVFSNETFRSLKATYYRMALDMIQIYKSDAEMNGLKFDVHKEEEMVELFAQNIIESGKIYLESPTASPNMPTWRRIESAAPSILKDLNSSVLADLQD